MKQIFYVVKEMLVVMASCVVVLLAFSCTKTDELESENLENSSKLIVSIIPQGREGGNGGETKSVAPPPAEPDENKVNMLELFVFNGEGDDAGDLDAYKKLESDELDSLTGIEMRSTTGKKVIYAVVNSHNESWTGVRNLGDFKSKLASLQKEGIEDFTMVGSIEETLQITTSVSISVARLVAKVKLAEIKTDFSGTPYEGTPLENVKVYLTNVYGNKSYALNADSSTPLILNSGGAVSEDVSACTMPEIIYKELEVEITDVIYSIDYSFYCYENMVEAESDDAKYTRLVIEGELNGNKYYYPINVNREGFGYTSESDHCGIKRNTSYELNVVICRPGSTDPDEVLEYGTLTTSINVVDWVTIPSVQVEF